MRQQQKNAARTCKKLPVASFCASETAETGRIANGREQDDHVGGDRGLRPSGLPGTIQSSVGDSFGDTSDGTSRNRFFAQNGGEKALNRCDVRALQRKDLERTSKEKPCSLQTVGYGWVRMGGGGQNRTAFSAHARQFKNEKPFINPLRQHFSTTPKLTEVSKFHPQNPTVSLQKDDSFSKLCSLASALR